MLVYGEVTLIYTLPVEVIRMKRDMLMGAALSALFILVVAFWMATIPQDSAPDEFVHYEANAKFIADNLRLPVSGIDDLRFLKNCRDNPNGLMPCTNSYNTYPAVSYIVSAVSIKLFRPLQVVSDEMASRFPNLLWGTLLVASLYLAARNLGAQVLHSILCTLSICLIPQVVFVFSYLNQDVVGLSTAACCLYAMTVLAQKLISNMPIEFRHQAFTGIAVGLLLSSKYNYFVYIPFLGIFFLWALQRKLSTRAFTMIGLIALAVASPWYIRNYILYQDLLGQNYLLSKMQEFSPLGISRSLRPSGIEYLFSLHWVYTNFQSFVAVFGKMNLLIASSWYMLMMLMVVIFVLGSYFLAGLSRDRTTIIAVLGATAVSVLVIVMSAYHSLVIDFQAQGRYLFPLLLAVFYAAVCLSRQFPKSATIFLGSWLLLIGVVLGVSTRLIALTY
jgi:hypothetical protein